MASSESGAGWIIRDSAGKALYHGRRSFNGVLSNAQADLLAISLAAEVVWDLRLKNIQFEFSSVEAAKILGNPLEHPSAYHLCYEVFKNVFSLPKSSMFLVPGTCNVAASAISDSVTRDQRHQSYIALGGPQWLRNLLSQEATSC
ncbi:hypothetical protein N665_0081s0056 [Sinapis alba]|nr:hypothetical protein N665_0081s0056 [Sinapis alba]